MARSLNKDLHDLIPHQRQEPLRREVPERQQPLLREAQIKQDHISGTYHPYQHQHLKIRRRLSTHLKIKIEDQDKVSVKTFLLNSNTFVQDRDQVRDRERHFSIVIDVFNRNFLITES